MASNLGGLTVGDFLLEKLGNMSKWVEAETGDSVMMNAVHKGGATLATAFAIEARKRKELIKNRDWVGLTESNLPASISEQIPRLLLRKDMHDKFWRYLDMFVSVADYNFQQVGVDATKEGCRKLE